MKFLLIILLFQSFPNSVSQRQFIVRGNKETHQEWLMNSPRPDSSTVNLYVAFNDLHQMCLLVSTNELRDSLNRLISDSSIVKVFVRQLASPVILKPKRFQSHWETAYILDSTTVIDTDTARIPVYQVVNDIQKHIK